MRTVIEILGKESVTVQIKNKEQLYDEGLTGRNAKPFWEKKVLIFEKDID